MMGRKGNDNGTDVRGFPRSTMYTTCTSTDLTVLFDLHTLDPTQKYPSVKRQ